MFQEARGGYLMIPNEDVKANKYVEDLKKRSNNSWGHFGARQEEGNCKPQKGEGGKPSCNLHKEGGVDRTNYQILRQVSVEKMGGREAWSLL